MTTLREQIQKVIEAAGGDAGKAAIDVCKVLEDEVGLQGNGWFDDDEVMLAALATEQIQIPNFD